MNAKKTIGYTVMGISIIILVYMYVSGNEFISPIWIGILSNLIYGIINAWDKK